MKETKRQLTMYSFMDFPAMERQLEEMAAKGWMIEKADSIFWRYRRTEPKKVHFAVTFFPKASAYDPGPSEEQRTMWEFAEQTGWKLAAQAAQWQFFYNEAEDPIPMETDAMVRVENIHQAAKRGLLPQQGILAALAVIQILFLVIRFFNENPVSFLTSSSNGMSAMCWLIVIFLGTYEIVNYLTWHRRAVELAEQDGTFLKPASTRKGSMAALAVLLVTMGLWLVSLLEASMLRAAIFGALYAAAVFILVKSLMKLMKRLGVSAKVNLAVTLIGSVVLAMILMGALVWLIMDDPGDLIYDDDAAGTYLYQGEEREYYADELPLRVEDMVSVEYTEYSCRWRGEGSWLLTQKTGRQWPRLDAPGYAALPKLEYTITEARLPLLYDSCRKWLLAEQDETDDDRIPEGFKNVYEPVDAVPWGALEAYQLRDQSISEPMQWYLLCYADRIVEIIFYDWTPTVEQMAIVGQRLGTV